MFDFDKLKQSLNELWSFIVPPIINITLLLLITVGSLKAEVILNFNSSNFYENIFFIQNESIQKFIKVYQLQQFIPILSLIILLSILNFANKIIYEIGKYIPVYLLYNPDAIHVK